MLRSQPLNCEANRWKHLSWTFSGTFWNLLRNPAKLLNLTWLCTKASHPFRRLSPEPCWTWPGSAPKPPRPSPEPSEPFPEPRWTWPGACTSAHRSYSGLKTPLAYAVGEKWNFWFPPHFQKNWWGVKWEEKLPSSNQTGLQNPPVTSMIFPAINLHLVQGFSITTYQVPPFSRLKKRSQNFICYFGLFHQHIPSNKSPYYCWKSSWNNIPKVPTILRSLELIYI